jgi:AraC-like DNA-binding protein
LYVLSVVAEAQIAAWQPSLTGVREVLHARFVEHAYPMHTHDSWTLLIIDSGLVQYDLDHHRHGAMTSLVTLLPPDVPHDGRSIRPEGFRKRVLYLDRGLLGDDLIGPAVDNPGLADPLLRLRVHQLHNVLTQRTEDLEAQSRLWLIRDRLQEHLRADPGPAAHRHRPELARRLRELLDARVEPGITLEQAAGLLHSHPTHLVRAFGREYGMPPHLYLTGRRVELARRHLLAGRPPAEAAVLAGFYDQSHLARHFRRMLGISPTRYARNRSSPATDPDAADPSAADPGATDGRDRAAPRAPTAAAAPS